MADLTDKQRVFVAEYLRCLNATEAAKRAGYSEKTAYAIGWENLRKPEIAEAISAAVTERAMPPTEVIDRLGEQARGSLAEVITFRTVRTATTIRKPARVVIQEIDAQIAFEEEYADRAGLNEDEMKALYAEVARMRRRIVRLEMELERDPNAMADGAGPIIEERIADVDLAKADLAGKLHLVKSYNAKDGKVELYDAHAALVDIGKHHGLFKDVTEVQLDWDKLSEDELQRIRNGEDPRKVIRER